ncbi:MAG: MerR family transcriptional regulator [Eubacteriaceae bacterium]
MGLKIGDVSKLLNIPIETIRYYETKHIINPDREENNNFRIYKTWDIFFLIECMKLKSFGLTLKEVNNAINKGSLKYLLNCMNKNEIEMIEKIKYDTLLLEQLQKSKNKLDTITLNQGNYWIQKSPDRYYFYCVEGKRDNYKDIDKSNYLLSKWLQFIPFLSGFTKISLEDFYNNNDSQKWFYSIEKKYAELFKLEINESVLILPEQYYITTIINAGEKGELTIDLLTPVVDYVKDTGYKINGDIICEVVARTHEKGKYCRFLEVLIPIEIDMMED